MAKLLNLQWFLSGEVFWRERQSSGESSSEHSALRLFLAQKGTCAEANIVTPSLQPFHPDLYTMSLTVFRQKGEGSMWTKFAHLGLRATLATHTLSFPQSCQGPEVCVPGARLCPMSALITLSCKDYCILNQALQSWNIPEPKEKWITQAHFLLCFSEWYLGSDCKMLPWSRPHSSSVVVFYEYLWIF